MATVKQMKARMLPFHREVLAAIRDNTSPLFAGSADCEFRGYQKVLRTLSQWGAIDRNGLTDIGRELLR